MSVLIRPEVPEDRDSIRKVNCEAFGGDAEADLVEALREQGYVELSLVAEYSGVVVGHLLFSRITLITGSTSHPVLSLAPLAVLPKHQRTGIGSQLMVYGLNRCRQLGHKSVFVLGHSHYYPKFGFDPQIARTVVSPFGGGDSWMALELSPGSLNGVTGRVEFSPPFMALE